MRAIPGAVRLDRKHLPGGIQRRQFLTWAASGTVLVAMSGCSFLAGAEAEMEAARNEKRADGKPRLPPGQYLLKALKPMGGDPGDPSPSAFRLRVYGQVKKELELSFSDLLALPQVQQRCDVHCVTKWTVLDSEWTGVRLQELADLAGVRSTARHVIFEAAHGYTANVPLAEALLPNVLIAHQHRGDPLAPDNGPPARSLVPDLYFWKSAKWITGVRFQAEDEPGYWETRGYHNHADPWKEERHSDV